MINLLQNIKQILKYFIKLKQKPVSPQKNLKSFTSVYHVSLIPTQPHCQKCFSAKQKVLPCPDIL